MAVNYKKLLHRMIEENLSNQDLMRMSNISANMITKLRTGQYISLEKIEAICTALHCTPNDILEFTAEDKK